MEGWVAEFADELSILSTRGVRAQRAIYHAVHVQRECKNQFARVYFQELECVKSPDAG